MNDALFTSKKDDWETPDELFKQIDAVFHFTLDACASHSNTKSRSYFDAKGLHQHRERLYTTPAPQGCLSLPWPQGVYWMNPPYGRRIGKFVARFVDQCRGNSGVALLPARVDTKWFQENISGCTALFMKGRIHFSNAEQGAPFPSVLIAAGADKHKLSEVMIPGVYCCSLRT